MIIEACCSVPYAQDLFVMVATYGNYRAVTDMLEVGTIDVNAPCSSGMVALLEATRNAHEAVVDRLLNDGNVNLEVTYGTATAGSSPVSPSRKTRTHIPAGMTALVLAATSFAVNPGKFAHIIAVLANAGADTCATDEQDNTVLVGVTMHPYHEQPYPPAQDVLVRQPSNVEVTKHVAQVLPVVLAQRVLRLLDGGVEVANQPVSVLHDAISRAMTDGCEANPAAMRMEAMLQGVVGDEQHVGTTRHIHNQGRRCSMR